jgi:aerobic carbon-monoxide dehydrogenase medium subunit
VWPATNGTAEMKPPLFDYRSPLSLDEALALRSEYRDDSAVLAGGQSLMPMLNLRLASPEVLIDLGRVAEVAGIRELDGGVSIGAMTRQRHAERSELVRERAPLVQQALAHVGHPTIRNRGTVGGSLAHGDPAAELPAVCIALDAELVARSATAERTIAAEDFYVGFMSTALAPDELLVEVRIPAAGARGTAFVEIARRHGDFALVGVAAAIALDDEGVITDARLVFTGVGLQPVRAHEAEASLRGAAPGADAFAVAAELVPAALQPRTDAHASSDYRRRVAGVIARRALEEAMP